MYKLTIKNFQSISDLEIVLKGFSTLVGKSNRGKSAIVRALRAILCNEWNPSYLKEGEKECILSFEILEKSEYLRNILPDFDIQKIVLRKPINEYTVYLEDGSKLSYPKVGKGVPEVFSKIALSEITTEREDTFNLNFQAQLDSLFLITNTDVVVSSFINKVFDIARFERALRDMASDDIKMSKVLSESEERIPLFVESIRNETCTLGREQDALKIIEEKTQLASSAKDTYFEIEKDVQNWEVIDKQRTSLSEQKEEVFVGKTMQGILKDWGEQVSSFSEIKEVLEEVTDLQESLEAQKTNLFPSQHTLSFLSGTKESLSSLYYFKEFEEESKALKEMQERKSVSEVSCGILTTLKASLSEHVDIVEDVSEYEGEVSEKEELEIPLAAHKVVSEFFVEAKKLAFRNIKECPLCKQEICAHA